MTYLRCTMVLGAPSARGATRFSSIGGALLASALLGACASSQLPAPVASADVAKSYKQAGKPPSGSSAGAGTASAVGDRAGSDGVGSASSASTDGRSSGARSARAGAGPGGTSGEGSADSMAGTGPGATGSSASSRSGTGIGDRTAYRRTREDINSSSLSDSAGLGEDETGAGAQARAGSRPEGRSVGNAGGSDAFGDDDGGLARRGPEALGGDGHSATGAAGTAARRQSCRRWPLRRPGECSRRRGGRFRSEWQRRSGCERRTSPRRRWTRCG